MVNTKHAFWIALVFTVLVFCVGLIFGYFLEKNRGDEVQLNLLKSEIALLDEQIRNDRIFDSDISCELAKKNTFDFANRIYDEAVKLEKYDSTSKFNRVLKTVHKRYDLMRVMLFSEGKHIQEECNSSIDILVYFFNYDEPDVNIRAQQTTYSRVLVDFKEKYGDRVLLIPIASNLDLASVDLLMQEYNVSKSPSILINQKFIIYDIDALSDIENIVFNSNKE